MPVIPGDNGIKIWSYEMLIDEDSGLVCESCLIEDGEDPKSDKFQRISADTEWDSFPVCDACGKPTSIFSPTGACIETSIDMLENYIIRRDGNVEFLDFIADAMRWWKIESDEEKVLSIYKELREWEQMNGNASQS